MSTPIQKIVIVGGGTAGWITAGLIAAKRGGPKGLDICVLESPDIPIIGVGEGTWPTLRATLRDIGVSERDFIRACDASFKQGSKFQGWHHGGSEFYYHPFDLPAGFDEGDIAQAWLAFGGSASFSAAVCPQEHLCERQLAPKQVTSPDYAGITNYGYHLDAGTFAEFIKQHCTEKLGVELISDEMTGVQNSETGDISGLETRHSGVIEGDLFVDCTGFRSLLLGKHLGVGIVPVDHVLFADCALAVQVPYGEDEAPQSVTLGTAQDAGWIWDVSLASRRGLGHVYSSAHTDDDRASNALRAYLKRSEPDFAKLSVRKLTFKAGYREQVWARNCVAAGLSAGFVEPLEASAIMLVETTARLLADRIPKTWDGMARASGEVNKRVTRRWEEIVRFLKLHYVLSERTSPFWRDHRATVSVPEELAADLERWARAAPGSWEQTPQDVAFPAASYQYVLYGMGFQTATVGGEERQALAEFAGPHFEKVTRDVARLPQLLETNADLLGKLTD